MPASLTHITNPKFRELCERILKQMKRYKVPGVSIGVWNKGREYSMGFGMTNVRNPQPVTADTLFQAGSITKTVTGTMLMQLMQQGKVDLDAPVRRYIKDFKLRSKKAQKEATVRDLLTHMGGWVGDYFNDFGNGGDALAKMVNDISKLEQAHPFRTLWSYNNVGFNVAARIIEVVTNMSYEQAAQEMLFDPLELNMSFFYPDDILLTHRVAVGHQKVDNKVQIALPWAIGRAGNGVGGLITTVKDLLKYARFHMGKGSKKVITAKNLRAMRLPQVDAYGKGEMGITWFIKHIRNITIYGHGGATNGQRAYLFFIPDRDFALAVLSNSDDGNMITSNIVSWALEVYFNTSTLTPTPIKTTPAERKKFAGRY
ncbi:MAG TPA: serine hydrolase domain-containing protein, partial [Anaerolineales bacterium]|nr:serine hydrolase domain-containing protein [Anaerolineales bacterium]